MTTNVSFFVNFRNFTNFICECCELLELQRVIRTQLNNLCSHKRSHTADSYCQLAVRVDSIMAVLRILPFVLCCFLLCISICSY